MANTNMRPAIRKLALIAALALAGLYAFATLRGPQGLPALLERRGEIRELREKNADLATEIETRRERIRSLRDSRSAQELAVRDRLKLLKEKETTFIIQDPQQDAPLP